MKRLLLVAVMVLVSLVGMVGFSRDAKSQNIQQSICPVIECIEFNVVQSTTNPTTGAVNELLETVYDLDTVLDWEVVYAWEKVYARVPASAKMYYLTVASFTGGDAITACDTGFHMASISEIQDSSNLQYATRSTPAYDSLVDGQKLGPPSNRMGWVRSGVYPPSGLMYDCEDFSDNRSGTTLSLNDWFEAGIEQTASTPNMWWQSAHSPCSQPEPVWCVEDPA